MREKVGLIAVDSKYPNLALMKLSTWAKSKGYDVEWYNPFSQYRIVFMSKIFNFTPDYEYPITNAKRIIKGGTGYDINVRLPELANYRLPDYDIYNLPKNVSMGFITRGCPNKCPWCIVPQKEGKGYFEQTAYSIAEHGKRPKITLMDNNFLALPEVAENQLKVIIKEGYRVDFNQGLDARLVDDNFATLLARVKWLTHEIRFGCDTEQQVYECERAINLIRSKGYNGKFSLYTIINDNFEECCWRLMYFHKDTKISINAQPYRDTQRVNQVPQWQKDMTRWANRTEIYRSCDLMHYKISKNQKFKEYAHRTK